MKSKRRKLYRSVKENQWIPKKEKTREERNKTIWDTAIKLLELMTGKDT